MTDLEELESRLDHLPDVYPDFTKSMLFLLQKHGTAGGALNLLREYDNATTETVIHFDLLCRGIGRIMSEEELKDEA